MAGGKAVCLLIVFYLCVTAVSLPAPVIEDYDVDGGRDLDIFDINEESGLDLVEGDIVLDEKQTRNSIIGDQYRWPQTVPYYMEDDLEINAKGVILKAFEQYRLKTCIDFQPWSGEKNYISIFKGNGCYSSVGNRHVGKQRLSIGTNCDRIATIEHEFLHALGFWHEQSRSDRDDYVKIMWDRISEGKEHNFNTYDDTTSSSLGVPYDYGSMMHYSKNAFRNGTEPTIVTNIPAFSDVIGQRMEFSDSDLLKLSRSTTAVTKTSTFLDSCDFERENICGMIQGAGATADWLRVSAAAGGPTTDYSNLGKCTGKSTTRSLAVAPCKFGRQKKIPSGFPRHKRDTSTTPGGMSLDDINLSETTCPEFAWRVKNFNHVMDNTPEDEAIYSPPFTSKEGYSFQMKLYPNGTKGNPGELAVYANLVAREGDTGQKWPCPWKQITMMLMDQNPHIQKRMSNQRSVTTDPSRTTTSGALFWDDPRKVGSEVTDTDGVNTSEGRGWGPQCT
ncbi:hypothetical protein WMY93_001292 [Mugilogobius chulae]|uniref:Metalloendopeptidase n=1 Tax=Mugilogobius chulae TaxID=88201 RepID=A0AAW0Q1V9_9GOBI